MPIQSTCTAGFSVSRPSIRAVGSPRRSAAHACAASCTDSEAIRTTEGEDLGEIEAGQEREYTIRHGQARPDSVGDSACTRAKCADDGVGGLGADDRRQLLARGAAHAGEAAEAGQQRLAAPRADARNLVELRPQIAHGRAPGGGT